MLSTGKYIFTSPYATCANFFYPFSDSLFLLSDQYQYVVLLKRSGEKLIEVYTEHGSLQVVCANSDLIALCSNHSYGENHKATIKIHKILTFQLENAYEVPFRINYISLINNGKYLVYKSLPITIYEPYLPLSTTHVNIGLIEVKTGKRYNISTPFHSDLKVWTLPFSNRLIVRVDGGCFLISPKLTTEEWTYHEKYIFNVNIKDLAELSDRTILFIGERHLQRSLIRYDENLHSCLVILSSAYLKQIKHIQGNQVLMVEFTPGTGSTLSLVTLGEKFSDPNAMRTLKTSRNTYSRYYVSPRNSQYEQALIEISGAHKFVTTYHFELFHLEKKEEEKKENQAELAQIGKKPHWWNFFKCSSIVCRKDKSPAERAGPSI